MLTNRCLLWSAGVALAAASTVVSAATAQRTFVSSSGTANPSCSRAAPCRQFADAIPATSPGGEVIVLDSAGYGPVTITKSVSIIAPPGIYAGISVFAGNGVTVNAAGATVVLRGLTINGQGGANGVVMQQAARVRIESCVISNMNAIGIYHQAPNAEAIVLDTILRDNGDTGIALVADDGSIVLDRVRSEHNKNYGFYMAPTPGSASAKAMISDSLFSENGGEGVWADAMAGADTTISVERTVLSNNGQYGFYATSSAAGSHVWVTLTRNSTGANGSGGIYTLGIPPGHMVGIVSENAVADDVIADGSFNKMQVSANTGAGFLRCANGSFLFSLGNNNTNGWGGGSCTYTVGPGF